MTSRTAKFTFRSYPTESQKRLLNGYFGSARYAYNDYLTQLKDKRDGKISEVIPMSRFGLLPPDRVWIKEYSQKIIDQSIRTAKRSVDDFFNGLSGKRKNKVGYPHFKNRNSDQSITWNGKGSIAIKKLNAKWAAVRLPSSKEWIKFRLSRKFPSFPTGVTLKKNKIGEYSVSFTVQQEIAEEKDFGPVSGMDLGLIDLASVVNSDGERYKIANPRHLRKAERRLRKAHQDLSRKQKGSKNREKARLRLANQHQKVANTRKDFHRKIALQLASENQVVCLETLSIEGMKKNRRLAKSVSDASFALLRKCIEEACQKLGARAILIDRWAPTSQICCVCGCLPSEKKDLSVREWKCPDCGVFLDRDYNAAVNILVAAGLAETLNACGENIRLQLAGAGLNEAGTSCSGSSNSSE